MVIDKETGQTPLSAAERMDLYDRNRGIEPIRPARTTVPREAPTATLTEKLPTPNAQPAPDQHHAPPASAGKDGKARIAAAIAERNKRPWTQKPSDRPALKSTSKPAHTESRPAAQPGGQRKTIVTGKWWDSKGPRTIELGPKGQQTLSGGFVTLVFALLAAAIIALFIEPILLFVGGFLLFRFGGHILGPIGAGIVDKALAERN